MQQNERIELIKAAAMLTHALANNAQVKSPSDIINTFAHFYDYLRLKLEVSGNDNETN